MVESQIKVELLTEFPDTVLKRAAELYVIAGWIDDAGQGGFLAGALRGSAAVAGAWDGEKLIGMARVLSDGCSDGYIQDVVVDPACRGQGIGTRMIRLLAQTMRARGVDWLALVGEPGTEGFYRSLGLTEKPGYTLWQFPDCEK